MTDVRASAERFRWLNPARSTGGAMTQIENARSFRQVAQQRQWLASSIELTQELFAGPHQDPMALVLRHATAGAAADFGRVVVPIDDRLGHVRAEVGAAGAVREGQVLKLEHTICEQVLQSGQPVLVDDYEHEFAELPADQNLPPTVHAVVGVPMVAPDGAMLGALVVGREREAVPFDPYDVELLQSFSTHASVAITLARARADQEQLRVAAERGRIAADLHDHIIQELFAMGLQLHGLAGQQSEPTQRDRLVEFVDTLDEAIRHLRTTIFALTYRPSNSPSLIPRLSDVLDQERDALGFDPHFHLAGRLDSEIPEALADDVVAVVREALSNVARHAQASSVSVSVSLSGPNLKITVLDDGVGIGAPSRSSGLANLRRRAETHAGTFQVHPRPTGGTHLQWTAVVQAPRD